VSLPGLPLADVSSFGRVLAEVDDLAAAPLDQGRVVGAASVPLRSEIELEDELQPGWAARWEAGETRGDTGYRRGDRFNGTSVGPHG
jgi:hypothetical protein